MAYSKMTTSFLVTLTFLFFQTFAIATSSNVTCIQTERESLLLFKQALTNSHNLLSTWSGLECCEWHGVGCDSRNGHVVKLHLRSSESLDTPNKLEGKLNPSLQNLKHLRYLDLSINNFKGNIPKFLGSFKRLEYLNLSLSGFSGKVPHHLGNLSRLQYLDIRFCDTFYMFQRPVQMIYATTPMVDDLGWVSSLSSLRYLDLSGITIGKHIDWFHSLNMLPSLLTLNLAWSDINFPSIEFANFTSLTSLDLSHNHNDNINSSIPVWLTNLTGLTHLNLHQNNFHGKVPDFVGMFSALASIDLSFNSFDTLMPDLLCNLTSLVSLDLNGNKFFGPIPPCIGQLLRLESLNLYYNQLSGNIPMNLWQLSKLKSLDLSENSLVGVLSENYFTMLKNLNHLELSMNSITLNFSSRWNPPFQLQEFYASSCNIGPHFPNWLQTQTNLQTLVLSNSSIRDTIPKWFENILYHLLFLDLSNNQIGGKLPQFHFVNSNGVEGVILKMNSNKFEGSIATFPQNVQILDLSNNSLSGSVPQTNGTMNSSITILNLSKNKFSGRFPPCIGNLNNLEVLDLSDNTISGPIPSSLGSFTGLRSLHLQNNKFAGNLPLSLKNLTKLDTMDIGNNFLEGSIPFWIGENLSSLKILRLQSNKFTGKIPLQLCQLNALQQLNLAQNNITGRIPQCFGNLSGMITSHLEYYGYYYADSFYEENILAYMKGNRLLYTTTLSFLLDLSSNNITGEIPDVLMNLVGLTNMNLSRNQLKGHIPMTIGSLSKMESLDLLMNKLSGWIPQSLTRLNFLSYLNISYNNLSGAIPTGNQLQTLVDPYVYEGNEGLCGPPVSRSCKEKPLTHDHDGEDDGQDDDDEGPWFYSGMGSGFVAGFTGLVGSLYFIRAMRMSYFSVLERVYGWINVLVLLNLARLRRKFF